MINIQAARSNIQAIRVIGDVHGHLGAYRDIVKHCGYSVQLGDMGFRSHYKILRFAAVDPSRHVFIPGNHDDYHHLPPHALGPFGVSTLGGTAFFWVRGAESTDKHHRIHGESWWPDEELSIPLGLRALDCYSKVGSSRHPCR